MTTHTVVGRTGEALVARFLAASGRRCIGRNIRTRSGEIDLLTRRRRHVAAVEVKTRRGSLPPELAVDDHRLARQRRALCRLAPHLRPRPRSLSVDVVAVQLWPHHAELRLFPGETWDPGRTDSIGVEAACSAGPRH